MISMEGSVARTVTGDLRCDSAAQYWARRTYLDAVDAELRRLRLTLVSDDDLERCGTREQLHSREDALDVEPSVWIDPNVGDRAPWGRGRRAVVAARPFPANPRLVRAVGPAVLPTATAWL
jgi:hypothetical protein